MVLWVPHWTLGLSYQPVQPATVGAAKRKTYMRRLGGIALMMTAVALSGPAWGSASKCPASAPFHYERWTSGDSLVFPSSGLHTFTYQITGLENHKHWKSGVADWYARSGPTLPGSGNRRYILLWLRQVGGGYAQYGWNMALEKSGADEAVNQWELDSFKGPLSEEWATNTLYHFHEEWDAEAGPRNLRSPRHVSSAQACGTSRDISTRPPPEAPA